MKKEYLTPLLLISLLTGCNSTPPAPNFAGTWQPLNKYSNEIFEIPLIQQHYFEPMTIDGTLKNMLSRWARESETHINYQYPSDFTLPYAVSRIKQPNLESAIAEVNEIYAPQHISISLYNGQITVEPTFTKEPDITQTQSAKSTDVPSTSVLTKNNSDDTQHIDTTDNLTKSITEPSQTETPKKIDEQDKILDTETIENSHSL